MSGKRGLRQSVKPDTPKVYKVVFVYEGQEYVAFVSEGTTLLNAASRAKLTLKDVKADIEITVPTKESRLPDA